MASDPGLAAMLLWTISIHTVGTAGTNSNEGKRARQCVCVCVYERVFNLIFDKFLFLYTEQFIYVELLLKQAGTLTRTCTHNHRLVIKVCSVCV